MAGRKSDFTLPTNTLDDLFSSQEERDEAKLSKIRDIPLSEIDDFPDHPFKVREDEDMFQLVESIKERGVITPATVRQKEDGRYELISGHRRKKACELAGFETLRCEVVDLDRDEATILMVESNFQRSQILPSEKAHAYKMRLDAMKRQAGRPRKENSSPVGIDLRGKGELVDTVTTDETGFAKSKELYLGKYEVKEVKAGYGMVLSSEVHTVELIYAGQNVAVTETATSFVNERQKVEISLEKALETNELFGIGNNGEIKNISFGLFADEELVSASGTSIPKDGLLEIITLDENGRATVGTDLPLGSFYVKELATDEHYQLSGEKYPVVFEYAGQETATVVIAVNDGEPMENKLIYGSVSGKKVDENGEGLGGALIGLFKTDDVEFTEENALMTAVSGDDGSFAFENVPYGNWYIREIKPLTGFVLNETVYDVNISENEQVVEIEIVNELVRGNIALTKVDAEYTDTKLTGAVFEVYKDSNDITSASLPSGWSKTAIP